MLTFPNVSVVVDLAGTTLTEEDCDLLGHPAVSGVILFTRNYESRDQLKKLTKSIQKVKNGLRILVDQEGGRVQRFRKDFTELKAMNTFGETYLNNPTDACYALRQQLITMIGELQSVGVTGTLLPVLDLNYGRSAIIGERSFGWDPLVVSALGRVLVDTLHAHSMPVVAKHFPGHGFVTLDSHLELPCDDRDIDTLKNNDLIPFIDLIPYCDYLMPAHIVFPKIDSLPVGFSPVWLNDILRKELGFKGKIITDDLSMKATEIYGDYTARARAAIDAGCDILLVCNNRLGAIQVVEAVAACC